MVGPAGRHDGRRTRTERETSPTGAASDLDGAAVGDAAMLDVGTGRLDSSRAGGAGAFVQLAATSRAPTSMNRVATTPLTLGRNGDDETN
jgi:hypothetical protein